MQHEFATHFYSCGIPATGPQPFNSNFWIFDKFYELICHVFSDVREKCLSPFSVFRFSQHLLQEVPKTFHQIKVPCLPCKTMAVPAGLQTSFEPLLKYRLLLVEGYPSTV